MSIISDIMDKENEEYRDMPRMVKERMKQIKCVQIAREKKDLTKSNPKKIILPCINCAKPHEFFDNEAIKICGKCMY